jgi:superfamily I DNA and/or RNA helicase
MIPIKKHIAFYEHQIKTEEDEWKKYANTYLNILINEKKLFIGRIWGVSEAQGNVILRFRSGEVPRMKQPYFLGITGKDFPNNPDNLNFSLTKFRLSNSPRYYSGFHSEVYTHIYWKTEGNFTFIIVSGFDIILLEKIKKDYLSKNIHPLIVIAKTDPPIDYLKNLKDFIAMNVTDPILNSNHEISENDWHPVNIDNEKDILENVIKILDKNDKTLIQGPPGTGKSYLAANICEYFSSKNKSIVVTALTNKALMEIIKKDGLLLALDEHIVFKTNLAADELKKQPKLQRINDLWPNQKEVVLCTYYKLAQKQRELSNLGHRFDLLIIEEASQAYLATIAMFSKIAKKVLIIGDHKQLCPVVKKKEETLEIHPKMDTIINGLQTFAFNNNPFSYRLIKTRRLSNAASELTSLFYDNSLKSISDINSNNDLISSYKELFSSRCGNTIMKLPSSKVGFTEKEIIKYIIKIAIDILTKNSKAEISLLVPYVFLESQLYEEYIKFSNDFKRVTINTIHKIQGLTTDYTILYLPLQHPSFDVDLNLFNVATSRAKKGTLIITYSHIELITNVKTEVTKFIKNCEIIPFEKLKSQN